MKIHLKIRLDYLFKSKLEKKASTLLGGSWFYELENFEYAWIRTYTPDFSKNNVHFEVKGRFRPGDTARYRFVNQEVVSQGDLLVFVVQDRQCTACQQIIKWCAKHTIPCITIEELPIYKGCNDSTEFQSLYKEVNNTGHPGKSRRRSKSSGVDRKVLSRKKTRRSSTPR